MQIFNDENCEKKWVGWKNMGAFLPKLGFEF